MGLGYLFKKVIKQFLGEKRIKVVYKTYLAFKNEQKFSSIRDIDGLSAEVIKLVLEPKKASEKDIAHINIAKKAIFNYRLQKEAKIQKNYQPGPTWVDVYKNSSYCNPDKPATDHELMDALFVGARTDYLEGSSEFAIPLTWLSRNYDVRNFVYLTINSYAKSKSLTGTSFLDILNKVKPTQVGQPLHIYVDGFQLDTKTLPMVYYLYRLITLTGLKAEQEFVWCDLGSGAGYMAKVIKDFFPKATVILVDLPEALLFASYFMNMNFQNVRILYYEDFKDVKAISREDILKYDVILLPHFAYERLEENTVDISWNTMSLSEMSAEAISNYIKIIERTTCPKGYFYTVNRNIECENRCDIDVPLGRFPFKQDLWEIISYIKVNKFMDVFHEAPVHNGELLLRKRN